MENLTFNRPLLSQVLAIFHADRHRVFKKMTSQYVVWDLRCLNHALNACLLT